MTDEIPKVMFGPTDPVESARACVMEAIVKHRGEHSQNLVRAYCQYLDNAFLLTYAHAGYEPEQVEAIRAMFQTAKATAIRDRRVYAYLWF
jgi:hypothetical protein